MPRKKETSVQPRERDWDAEAQAANSRDPREAPYGILAGDSFALSSLRAFLWFVSIDDLIEYVLEGEPRLYNVAPGKGLEEYQTRVRPILALVGKKGLTEALLARLDPTQDGGFVIDWWGTYEELRDGETEFAMALRERFYQRQARMRGPLKNIDEEFAQFVYEYGA